MNIIRSTTELAMHLVRPYINSDSTVIDATCGNGHDTVSLAKAIIASASQDEHCTGLLLAFDIQQEAIEATANALFEAGLPCSMSTDSSKPTSTDSKQAISLICESHENMDKYTDFADVIVFNLGYFPGGDKSITTKVESTMNALNKALLLLRKDGIICITMYSGHEAGAVEKAAILEAAKTLDNSKFHVAYVNMANQRNNPPEILLITKKK